MSIIDVIEKYNLVTEDLDDLMTDIDKDAKFFSDYLFILVNESKIPQEYYQQFFEDEIDNVEKKELIDKEKFDKILSENWLKFQNFIKLWYDEKIELYKKYVNSLLTEWAKFLISENTDIESSFDMISKINQMKLKYKLIVSLIPSWYKKVASKASEAVFSVLTWWRK